VCRRPGFASEVTISLMEFKNFTFMWPCIITHIFKINPFRCTNFTNLFWRETLHVSCQNKFVKLVHLVGFVIKEFKNMSLYPSLYTTNFNITILLQSRRHVSALLLSHLQALFVQVIKICHMLILGSHY
jgi:hypothetical protein